MKVPPKLVFVSGNAYKINELRIILGETVEIEAVNLDLPEIQGTIEEIAKEKCQRAAEVLQKPVLIDDTSLCFNAMGGLPGPYIKWFLQALGNENLHRMLAGFEDKTAQFVCTLAYSPGPGKEVVLLQEQMDGKIVPARGKGSGWNPVFEIDGQTFGEMELDDIRLIGARSRVIARLQKWIMENSQSN
ncbi:inosine triphosphate pyrophosphatase-like protein [Corynespora cassiicola Philippines]|uniref:XTP/dITP diphosphatase n=1 Tax=Corynespora cassiicola Philippines TaxID=1448308 RepID=A0A2T2NK40_CORCC|nr:inosine triphosphate pyrophosphatase-like protein [Corynespora cassiicola Philippines]